MKRRFIAAVIIANESEKDPEDKRTFEDILSGLQVRQRRAVPA